jgi:hypothetical protein
MIYGANGPKHLVVQWLCSRLFACAALQLKRGIGEN